MTLAFDLHHAAPWGFLVPPVKASRAENEKIGIALRQARKRAWGQRGSLARTAELAGVSTALLSMIERGDHPLGSVRPDALRRFPEAYGMTSQEFAQLTGVTLVIPAEADAQTSPENVRIVDNLHRVPVRTLAAAGSAFYTDGAVVDYEHVPAPFYFPAMLVVQVVGDSMAPTIADGDYVYIDTRALDAHEGKVVLAHVHGDGFVIKRVRTVLGSPLLASDNPAHGAVHADEVTIVGTAYRIQPQSRPI